METITTETKYDYLVFDMDDTLYPLTSGVNLACRKNIQDFMLHNLHIEESQVPKMCLDLYKEYGTTMAGLKVLGYGFDNDEFHAYVHGRLPYETLKPDPVLRSILLSAPQRKIIFTNADKVHTSKVISRLGLEDCFDGVICFETLNNFPAEKITTMTDDDLKSDSDVSGLSSYCTDYNSKYSSTSEGRILCKPSPEAFETAIAIANIDPKRTIFFDDSPRNIAAGKAAGLHTVLVGSSVLVPGADLALESIHNIREALPEIWQDGEQFEPVLAATSAEAVVLA